MSYVDGFVIPVPAGKKDAYREVVAKAAPIFMEYGATRLVECWGDDIPDGTVTDFKRAVKAEADPRIEALGSPRIEHHIWEIMWMDVAAAQAAMAAC